VFFRRPKERRVDGSQDGSGFRTSTSISSNGSLRAGAVSAGTAQRLPLGRTRSIARPALVRQTCDEFSPGKRVDGRTAGKPVHGVRLEPGVDRKQAGRERWRAPAQRCAVEHPVMRRSESKLNRPAGLRRRVASETSTSPIRAALHAMRRLLRRRLARAPAAASANSSGGAEHRPDSTTTLPSRSAAPPEVPSKHSRRDGSSNPGAPQVSRRQPQCRRRGDRDEADLDSSRPRQRAPGSSRHSRGSSRSARESGGPAAPRCRPPKINGVRKILLQSTDSFRRRGATRRPGAPGEQARGPAAIQGARDVCSSSGQWRPRACMTHAAAIAFVERSSSARAHVAAPSQPGHPRGSTAEACRKVLATKSLSSTVSELGCGAGPRAAGELRGRLSRVSSRVTKKARRCC